MRIAISADPELPVPPKHYVGIEKYLSAYREVIEACGHPADRS